jgi:hypothetical protein
MTSKEWKIPPRPKPGRKPAMDTPPTKRKAQNRAAQRAFRERRAARIGELEDKLEEQKEDHEKEERSLVEQIQAATKEVEALRARCLMLEGMLSTEREVRGQMEEKLVKYEGRPQQQPPRESLPQERIVTPPEDSHFTCGSCHANGPCACAEAAAASTAMPCGKCTLGSRCECLEAAIAAPVNPPIELKRPLRSPSPNAAEQKRHRSDAMEIDFTAIYNATAKRESTGQSATVPLSVPLQPSQQLPAMADKDGCGFCKEGTFCVCADAAVTMEAASADVTDEVAVHQSNPMTPPSLEGDVVPVSMPAPMEVMANGAVKLPALRQVSQQVRRDAAGCGANGPGTCAQCLADPKSGLFCRSLAATFSREGNAASSDGAGCCGNGGPGGCCKRSNNFTAVERVTLSCADTYNLLATHKNFDEAADQIGTWLPMLKAAKANVTAEQGHVAEPERRPAMEVEAASIMGVLKTFDVRFGKGL